MTINIRAGITDGALQYNSVDAITVTATGTTIQGALQTNALSTASTITGMTPNYSAVLMSANSAVGVISPSAIALATTRGTLAAPAATNAGDALGVIDFYGFGNIAVEGAGIDAIAGSLWTPTNAETYLSFYVTPINTIITTEKARLTSNGAILVNTTIVPNAATTGSTVFASTPTGDVIVANGAVLSLGTEGPGNYNFTGMGYSTANTNNASIGFKSQTRGLAATAAGDTFGNFDAFGWNGTAYAYSASIDFLSAGAFSATSYPSMITYNLTMPGATTPIQVGNLYPIVNTLNGNAAIFTTGALITTSLDAQQYSHQMYAYGTNGAANNAAIAFKSARGTAAAPTAVLTGDSLGDIDFYGYTGSSFGYAADLEILASGNWSSTSTPAYLNVVLTAPGSNIAQSVATLTATSNATSQLNVGTIFTSNISVAGTAGSSALANIFPGYSTVHTTYSGTTANTGTNAGTAYATASNIASNAAATPNGQTICNLDFWGHNGTTWTYAGSIDCNSIGAFTPTNTPTSILFNTTPFGSNVPILVANLTSNGFSLLSGVVAQGAYTAPYTDGTVIDYVTGNGRISVGAGDGIKFFNNGVGNVQIALFGANGISSSGYSLSTAAGGQGNIFVSNVTPTISSGFGTTPSIIANGSLTFRLNVGTGGVATTGVIGLPPATNGWNAIIQVLAPSATNLLHTTAVTASTTTSITLVNYVTSTAAGVAWPASTILIITATAY